MLWKMKSLRVNNWKRKLIITFVTIGLSASGYSFSFTVSIPPWLVILVYKDFTSLDTDIVSLVSPCTSLIFLGKSGVYEGRFCTCVVVNNGLQT